MRVKLNSIFVLFCVGATECNVDAFIHQIRFKFHSLTQSSCNDDEQGAKKRKISRPTLFANPINEQENDNFKRRAGPRKTNQRKPYKKYQGKKQPMEKRLESSLSNLFEISQGSNSSPQDSLDFLNQIGYSSKQKNSDAPRLDENMYLNSEQYLDEDGSIIGSGKSDMDDALENLRPKIEDDTPQIPTERNNDQSKTNLGTQTIIDDQALLAALANAQNTAQSKLSGDDLHQQVFANEQGFFEQSEAFRETLSSEESDNIEKENEAVAWRRGAEYRRKQEEAMALIENEMKYLEENAMSKEDARQLAAKERQHFQNEGTSANNSVATPNLDGRRDGFESMTLLCSRCNCLMAHDEIIVERRRGRGNPNQMLCRFCQVDNVRIKNGSPYLGGRLGRNGKPLPHMGMDSIAPTKDKVIRKKLEKIQKMAPRTEDFSHNDMYGYEDPGAGDKRTEAQSIAWREHFHATMTRNSNAKMNTKVPNRSTASNSIGPSPNQKYDSMLKRPQPSNTTSPSSQNNPNQKQPNNERRGNQNQEQNPPLAPLNRNDKFIPRYSNRIQDLNKHKDQYSKDVWNALRGSAMYRLRGSEQLDTVQTRNDPTSDLHINSNPQGRQINPNRSSNQSSELKQSKKEVDTLKAQIKELEMKVNDYELQVQNSSSQMKAMKSMIEGMNKHQRPVKKKRLPSEKNGVEKVECDVYLGDP